MLVSKVVSMVVTAMLNHFGAHAGFRCGNRDWTTTVPIVVITVIAGVLAVLSANRPCTNALSFFDFFCDGDLLFACCFVGGGGVLGSSVGVPCLWCELESALEAVSGVGGPVAAGFALGDGVPVGA